MRNYRKSLGQIPCVTDGILVCCGAKYIPVFGMSLYTIGRDQRRDFRRYTMKWQTPAASDMRFGFEITMYIANR